MVRIFCYLDTVIITPNIFTEVDNLGRQDARDSKRLVLAVHSLFTKVSEVYRPSDAAIHLPEYKKAGLTDTHLLTMASENHLIITDDLSLFHWLESLHRDAININHIRMM